MTKRQQNSPKRCVNRISLFAFNTTPRNVRNKLWFKTLVSSQNCKRQKASREKTQFFQNVTCVDNEQVPEHSQNGHLSKKFTDNSVDISYPEVSATLVPEELGNSDEEDSSVFKMFFPNQSSVEVSDDSLESDWEENTKAKIVHLRNTSNLRNCPLDIQYFQNDSDVDSVPFIEVMYTSEMKLEKSHQRPSSGSSLESLHDTLEASREDNYDVSSCTKEEADESVKIIKLEGNKIKKSSREEQMNKIFAVNIPEKNQIVVILPHPAEVVIKGISVLRVISGSVTVCGYNLDSNKPPVSLFSLKKFGHIKVSTCIPELRTLRSSKKNIAADLQSITGVHFRQMKNVFNHSSVVLLLQPAKTLKGRVDYALTHIGENSMSPSGKRSKLNPSGLTISPVKHSTKLACNISEEWLNLESIVQEAFLSAKQEESPAPRIVVCGGKNSGKSTLLRYLMNTILNVDSNCYHLEADIGQTEFSPPGCISLTCIDKPLFGPPFTHLKTPEKMYFLGAVSVKIPDDYLNAFTAAFEHYQHQKDLPLFVNTMGWTKDLGMMLIMDIVHIVQATHLIQINFEDSGKGHNFPNLTPQFVCNTDGWRFKRSDKKPLQYRLVEITSVSHTGHSSGSVTPVEARNLAILSYLGRLQAANSLEYLPVNAFYPYTVPWSAVAVYIYHHDIPQYQVLYALNATWVALCKVHDAQVSEGDNEMPKMLTTVTNHECLGFGIIRGIDSSKKLFYIITPEPIRKLQIVNALVRGSVNLPERLLLSQEDII